MSKAPQQKATLMPIMEKDIGDVSVFLHQHMNDRFSSEEWERGLRASWSKSTPNYGYMLKNDDGVVGAICALYSEQEIDGEVINVCNPHTWCVLEPYRGSSVNLVLSVIRQDGYHYTMFSPNKEGEEIFAYLGFKPLEREIRVLGNIPTPRKPGSIGIFTDLETALPHLSDRDVRCVKDHRDFNWLSFMFFTRGEHCGFFIYKRAKFKRLASANILYISDKSLFTQCWGAIRTTLLLKHGIFTTKVERRLLEQELPFSFETGSASAKFYLSDSLLPEAIDYTYSELVAMDL